MDDFDCIGKKVGTFFYLAGGEDFSDATDVAIGG